MSRVHQSSTWSCLFYSKLLIPQRAVQDSIVPKQQRPSSAAFLRCHLFSGRFRAQVWVAGLGFGV